MILSLPDQEIFERINRLQRRVSELSLTGVLIHHPVELYYFSGTAQSGYLFIPEQGKPVLFIRKYFPRAQAESPLENIVPFRRFRDIQKHLNKFIQQQNAKLGLAMDTLSVQMFNKLKVNFDWVQWVDVSMIIRHLRARKSPWEIDAIKQSSNLLDSVFSKIPQWLKIGMTELELAANIESFLRSEGHQGTLPVRAMNSSIHYGNVLFGASGATRGPFDGPTCGSGLYPAIPKGAGWRKLKPEEPVFIDLVAGTNGYLSDATRLYCLGQMPVHFLEAHKTCIQLQKKIIQDIEAQKSCDSIYHAALVFADEHGYSEFFMGPLDDKVRFVAHGIGLEIDELPIIAGSNPGVLENGSVIAIEPKMIYPDGAVGIENTWVYQKNEMCRLTTFPDNILEVTV